MDVRNGSVSTAQANNATTSTTMSTKKSKNKKPADPMDTNKLVEQTMARLERDAAGSREEEMEIEREVKKASRELSSTISNYDSPLARMEIVQKKYAQLYGDMKRLERDYQKAKKRGDTLQKEKDTAKQELTKMTSMKEKLEKLSRETNNENRKLRTDLQQIKISETRIREHLQDTLDKMVTDVGNVIDSHEQAKQHQETYETDELFRSKFRSFVDQYELRELHFTSVLRAKDLEIEYQKARLEVQRKAQEMESNKSHQLTRQVSTFSQTETELRSQLNIYVEKFKQVEDTLNNSNDLFLTFRKEMEEMSKKTKRLEKENLGLTRKHEATNQNIITMAEERTRSEKDIDTLRKQNDKLEKLCRGMQAQGRGQVNSMAIVDDGEGATGSEYDDDYDDEDEDEEGYDAAGYDDETEEEQMDHHQQQQQHNHPHAALSDQHRATTRPGVAPQPQRAVYGPTRPFPADKTGPTSVVNGTAHHQQQPVNGLRA